MPKEAGYRPFSCLQGLRSRRVQVSPMETVGDDSPEHTRHVAGPVHCALHVQRFLRDDDGFAFARTSDGERRFRRNKPETAAGIGGSRAYDGEVFAAAAAQDVLPARLVQKIFRMYGIFQEIHNGVKMFCGEDLLRLFAAGNAGI